MLRKFLLINWYIIVSILVLLAILISILRGYPSLYQNYLPIIQDNISSIVGKPVQADAIQIDWLGITPHVSVSNLFIFSDENKNKQLLYAKEALVSVDLYASLFQKKLTVRQLTLVGGNLEAVRTIDQRFILNGIDVSERIANRKKQNNKTKIRISLLESTIAIKDEIKNLDYFFDRVNVELVFNKDRFKISSEILLPETLGESLIVIADIIDIDKGLNNLKGEVYTKGSDINLELIGDFFPQLEVGIASGDSDFEIWGNITSDSTRIFAGKLGLNALQYNEIENPITDIAPGNEITDFETEFKIEGVGDNWNLVLINSEIQAKSSKWNGEIYEIKCSDCNKENFSISAALDYADITHILSTLQHFPKASERIRELFSKVYIGGELTNTRFSANWQNSQLTKYMYKSILQNSTISLPEQEFEISSLSGNLTGDHTNGSIYISDDLVNLRVGKVSEQPFIDQRLTGLFKWGFSNSGVIASLEGVKLITDNLSADLQGSVQAIEGKYYVDIQGHVPDARAETIKSYLPYKKLRPKLRKWLVDAIQGGSIRDGRLLVQGNLKNFPFKNKPGMFEVAAKIDSGILDYRKDWPIATEVNGDFIIKNKLLVANGYSGTILNSSITHLIATIDDLKLPRLVIDGTANGPAGDLLDFLQQSSLLKENSQIPKHISVSGDTKLDLNLVLTLTKKLEKERLINGTVEFDNSNLTVTSLSLPFTNLKGKINFDRNGAEGQELSAKLFGSYFNLHAKKSEGGRTLLTAFGDFDFDSYLSANHQDLNEYFKGTSPVTAFINLPRFGKHNGDKSLGIDIESTLAGLNVSLPKPFHKESNESISFSVSTRFQSGHSYPLYANYDESVFLQTNFNAEEKKISALELRMGDDQFDLPEQGIKVSGKFEQLNIQEWQDTFRSDNNKNSATDINEIDIQADVVTVSNIEFRDVNFKLNKDNNYWRGDIQSSVAKGEFQYPLDENSSKTATGTFDYLRFSKPENESKIIIDPRTIPALQIQSEIFEFDRYRFNDVELKTSVSPSGMVINSLTGEGEDLQIVVNGAWEINAIEEQSTNVDITLVTQNLHNSLNGLGFETGVTKGQGSITAKLNWPDAPYKFSVDSFLGTANLRFKDGEIASVKPGAGRIVGLVNLSEISRRLSLDFTDFFAEGYVFDKIRGDLTFKDANLTTENLRIRGPSADIIIVGRTGIVAKDYDQVITVEAQVSGGLPWIGLAVGGPIGAGVVIVGEKVAKKIGIDINKVTEVKYSMTGSWDDPKLVPIEQKVVRSTPSAHGNPSPQYQGQASPQPESSNKSTDETKTSSP